MKRLPAWLWTLAQCALVLIILAAVLAPARADEMVRRGGKTTLRLMTTACPAEVLALLSPEHHAQFRAAAGVRPGALDAGCWTLTEDRKMVYLKFADGSYAGFPLAEFEHDPGI